MDGTPDDAEEIQSKSPLKPKNEDSVIRQEPDKPPVGQGSWRRKVRLLFLSCCLVPLLGCGVISFFVYTCFNPTDRVEASVVEIPKNVDFVCIASESAGRIHVMKWYYHSKIAGFTSTPGDVAFGTTYSGGGDKETVAWTRGERYGVITRDTDRHWSITWFEADEAPVQGRGTVTGGGRVTFDLSKGRAGPLSEATVTEYRLDQVWPRIIDTDKKDGK